MVTAAFSPHIKASVASMCYHGYWPFRDKVAELNACKKNGGMELVIPFDREMERQNHMSYYDAANFASVIDVPPLMSCCLCDIPSPATTVWATFKSLRSEKKELMWSPGTNHELSLPFEKAAFEWLKKHMWQ
jgi:cephalosporin-C deacetylase-like acetyl esterase